MNLKRFYNEVLGFDPYNYQLKVAELLLNGKNVIISVPTGAGKTWSSIIPYLYARKNGITNFPQKLIYSLPLRTLANSIHRDVERIVANIFKGSTSLQTGESNNDIYFEKDIIFSTIDQTLSNFLCFPLPLSKSQANINAGALIGSYLVFDEFHLLEPELSMATALGTLKILGETCRYCIMTATLSDSFIEKLKANLPDAEIVTLNEFKEDIPRIKSLIKSPNKANKKDLIIRKNEKINANTIIAAHRPNSRTIVICNRVETVQNLYVEVNKFKSKETQVICLHSRFFDKDRRIKEAQIKDLFSKDSTADVILISTQVIEAGMDISCNVMHSEVSPVNSFLQRAGRCARFEGEYGIVYVYDLLDLNEKERILLAPENDEDKKEIRALNNKYLPYDEGLCIATLENLTKYNCLDEKIAGTLVNDILSCKENTYFEKIETSQFNKNKIRDAWKDYTKGHYRRTIRDIQSIEIVIIEETEREQIEYDPFSYESVGVFRWSFISWIKEKIEIARKNDEYCAWIAEENTVIDFGNTSGFCLKPVTDIKTLTTADRVFVNKNYFFYDPSLGLNFLFGNNTSPKKDGKIKDQYPPLKKDTYYQHCKALIQCYESELMPNLSFAKAQIARLLKKQGIEIGDIDQLIILMLILHDYGKLNVEWQTPIKAYQKEKASIDTRFSFDPNEILAHTDFDKNNKKDIELAIKYNLQSKPPHAGIGAIVIKDILERDYQLPEEIAGSVCNAIAKHHSVETDTYKAYDVKNNDNDVMRLLKEYSFNSNPIKIKKRDGFIDIDIINEYEYLLYFIFVRILRLADQKATENCQKYLL
ncbi:MAG: CRISPR-associated helicase Cas3' [Paludibacteraceae bacterium]|nr:CRISPR-associated helicase Cas3' [Paludibacteraceae bacterium]